MISVKGIIVDIQKTDERIRQIAKLLAKYDPEDILRATR